MSIFKGLDTRESETMAAGYLQAGLSTLAHMAPSLGLAVKLEHLEDQQHIELSIDDVWFILTVARKEP